MKILVVTGASGGHIFPALSFLEALKDKSRTFIPDETLHGHKVRDKYKDIDTLLILPKRSLGVSKIADDFRIRYISISTINLSFSPKNFIALLRFFKGSLESLILLLEFRPDIVVGFGSLACVPVVLLAWIFRIKTLIHEQNVIPGQANRLLAKFSDKIAISFKETRDYFKGSSRKIVFTGNLIRKELKRIDRDKALDFFGLGSDKSRPCAQERDKFTILVMGGSSGSHRINLGFLNAISKSWSKSGFQIIHLSGLKDYDLLKDSYKDLGINVALFSYLDQMQYAYSACDLVICRAGATSLSEIIFFGLPAIIIPYPFAYAHQVNNAKVLENKGCAIIIKDNELDGNILRQTIEDLINNPKEIKRMRLAYDNIIVANTNDLLVDEVFK